VIERAATEVFAEHGYRAASMDEIAKRSGVSAPVVYDHFQSKQDLHRRLLERHFADLRGIWGSHLLGDAPPEQRMAGTLDAWFGYVETHPYASRMLFRDTSGDPEVEAIHREVAARSREALLPLAAQVMAGAGNAGSGDREAVEMTWEVFRAVLQGLALWWHEHQHISRDQVVAVAMNSLWVGFERVQRGEAWQRGVTAPAPADASPGG
jgi:AcrR family transcriptional regulator